MRFLPFALALASTLPAFSQDKVEFKWNPKKGAKATRSFTIKGDGTSMQDLGGGGGGMTITLQQPAELNCGLKWAEEIVEVKSGAASALKRLYTREDYNVMLGAFGGKSGQRGLAGKELAGADGAWTAKDVGEDATKWMKSDDGLTAALASGKSVAKGDTWDADKDKLEDWLEGALVALKLSKVTGRCQFEDLAEKDGAKCVKFSLNVKSSAKLGDADDRPLAFNFEGEGLYQIDLGMVIEFKAEGLLKHAKPEKKDDDEDEGDEEEQKLRLDVPFTLKFTAKAGVADFDAKPEEPPKPPKPDWWPEPVR
jgi:hypothetical protein